MDQVKQSEYMVHVYKILLYVHTYVCTSPTACAYICMYEILLYLRMYCMYKILLYLCMYVCTSPTACAYVCMRFYWTYVCTCGILVYVWDSRVCMYEILLYVRYLCTV